MEDGGYEALQAAAEEHDIGPLPSWKEVPPEVQEEVLRVLRRLSLARALDPREGLGILEREVGIGEDQALRLHLQLTCLEMLADGLPEVSGAPTAARVAPGDLDVGGPFVEVVMRLLGQPTRDWICGRCWVYRDDPLVPWDDLDEVEADFSRNNGEDLDRLVAARAAWDEYGDEERLRRVAAVLRSILVQYTVGAAPMPRGTRSVWGNVGLLRKLAEAARADRLNLLSDTAFANLQDRDLPAECFRGASVVLDGDEAFIRRSEIPARELREWATVLANWKPRTDGGGEAVFAWDWGGALAVPGAPVAEHLESWIREALARLVQELTGAEAPSAAAGPATVELSRAS